MGEIAEMMLEGALCQWCGEWLGDGDGYPTVCAGCQHRYGVDEFGNKPQPEPEPVKSKRTIKCTVHGCNKGFASEASRNQHILARHKRRHHPVRP